jgi:multidrug efflux pump subunit AcrA (membrane-fusion protein)
MSIGSWLGDYSSSIQAIASVFAVFVAVWIAVVALQQARAAKAQAKAADAQVEAAKNQSEVAREQVNAARQQTETLMAIADLQSEPNISITPTVTRDGVIVQQSITFLNNGNGTARHVHLGYRDTNIDNQIHTLDSLVVRDSFTVRVDDVRAARPGLRFRYSTIFGTEWTIEFEWNGMISQPVNKKVFSNKVLPDPS